MYRYNLSWLTVVELSIVIKKEDVTILVKDTDIAFVLCDSTFHSCIRHKWEMSFRKYFIDHTSCVLARCRKLCQDWPVYYKDYEDPIINNVHLYLFLTSISKKNNKIHLLWNTGWWRYTQFFNENNLLVFHCLTYDGVSTRNNPSIQNTLTSILFNKQKV